jgi:hypothetical protein
MTPNLRTCPDPLPDDLLRLAKALACAWINHPSRLRVSKETVEHWDRLIEAWIAAEDMPLFVRKSDGNRGSLLTHHTGRHLVPTDNTPANWVFGLAIEDVRPTLDNIRCMLKADQIPVAMAYKAKEKQVAQFKCTTHPRNLNLFGWKICHVDKVGLGFKGELENISLADLKQHFRRTMTPHNMFLVPKVWSGLGEMPEMIDAALSVR